MKLTPEDTACYQAIMKSWTAKEGDSDAIARVVSSIIQFSQAFCPQLLFRYRTPSEYSFDDLENSLVTLTRPDFYQEDPLDSAPSFNFQELETFLRQAKDPNNVISFVSGIDFDKLGEMLEDLGLPLNPEAKNRFLSMPQNKLAQEFCNIAKTLAPQIEHDLAPQIAAASRASCHVLCLTGNPDNEYMWNTYASNHEGFMLIYRAQDIRQLNRTNSKAAFLLPILYQNSPLIANDLLPWATAQQMGLPLAIEDAFWAFKSAFVKRAKYAIEEEWRAWITAEEDERKLTHITRYCPAQGVVIGRNVSEGNLARCHAIAQAKGIPLLAESTFEKL